ncbi:MAG: helix-turn-helix transcriptional regulator [Aliivibrio sp.]|uniref:helix-turn-helix domain-containing protein n=1 Tax=Aliivibrio sp. TaxID=1872443 RepID=UPI001A3A40CC|nr:helix-turn-helix transcriptional regulator [Aliivibrio sp.]
MDAGTTYSAIVGNVIKRLRDTKSISQGDMAKEMGISQAAWSKLENGKSTLSASQLAKAADYLSIPTHQIIHYADDTKKGLKENGMTVTYDNKEAAKIGLMLLGAAAIGAIIATIVLAKK